MYDAYNEVRSDDNETSWSVFLLHYLPLTTYLNLGTFPSLSFIYLLYIYILG